MTDYSVFASPEFDPSAYANAILSGESYTTSTVELLVPAKEDVSVAISKLSFGIDDISKQIKNVVTTHHEQLLSQAASVNDLSGSLTYVRAGLTDLDSSVDKLRKRIHIPYLALQAHVSRLQKLQQASDVLRRTSRFVILARRLELQVSEIEHSASTSVTDMSQANGLRGTAPGLENEKERTISKAALTIAELVALLDGPNSVLASHERQHSTPQLSETGDVVHREPSPSENENNTSATISLRLINAVASHIRSIEVAQSKVTSEMENMVLMGLSTFNQSLLASSLQTAYNLRVLPELVQSLIADLSQAVEERIRTAFDLSRISKDAFTKDPPSVNPQSPTQYRSRIRTEPTITTAPQWSAVLWARLENMVEEMAECCVKIYTLEKVLKIKKDTISQVVFLDEAMQLLENRPTATFWTSLSRSLERHTRDSARSSTFLQQTLSTGYPRLLRLFHEFFAKIALHTDTVYTQTYQSPETVLVLRALANFESLYLSRSSNKLNETVGQAFAGGLRSPPGLNEGINIARSVANELDSARFDPLLLRSVAKNAAASLDIMLSRIDGLVVHDRSAVTLVGPSATPQQVTNGSVATCLYQCWSRLEKLEDEHSDDLFALLKSSVESMHQAFDHVVNPLLMAIRRELGAIIARLHRVDFGKPTDPMSSMGGSSSYMKELAEKLSFVKAEILSRFNAPDASRAWVLSIVKFVIRTFVLHVSIAKPLGESGKLQLTSDMTELEFALSAFMIENPQSKRGGNLEIVGDEYRALRAMRPLLFLDNTQLASSKYTVSLPPLIILHHILVRSPVPLPHSLHGWQEAEYVRWVDEHSEDEAWTLVEGGLSHWEKISEGEGKEMEDAAEYVDLARMVLTNAKCSS